MANSEIIRQLKSKVINDIVNNDDIVNAIDSPDKNKIGWMPLYLINNKQALDKGFKPLVFREHKNTSFINDVCTFITIVVQIQRPFSGNNKFLSTKLEIMVVSHNDHMMINDIKGVKDNRNDYLSMLIDKMLNSDSSYGTNIRITSNIEGVYDDKFNFRKLEFEGVTLNNSICGD